MKQENIFTGFSLVHCLGIPHPSCDSISDWPFCMQYEIESYYWIHTFGASQIRMMDSKIAVTTFFAEIRSHFRGPPARRRQRASSLAWPWHAIQALILFAQHSSLFTYVHTCAFAALQYDTLHLFASGPGRKLEQECVETLKELAKSFTHLSFQLPSSVVSLGTNV